MKTPGTLSGFALTSDSHPRYNMSDAPTTEDVYTRHSPIYMFTIRSDIDECMVQDSIHLCVATIACLQLCFTILIIPKGVNQYRTTIHYVRQIRLPLVQIRTKPSNMIPERSLIQNPDINTTTLPLHVVQYIRINIIIIKQYKK